jgi:hypothetical protein
MSNLPFYISFVFLLTTAATFLFFYTASKRSGTTAIVLLSWLATQAAIGLSGFYEITTGNPPRFALLVVPPLILIVILLVSRNGKAYVDGLDSRWLTLLHCVRVPVEIVLLWLSLQKVIPQAMTFEGRNFDILAGLTAPFVYYFGFSVKRMSRKAMLVWNFLCIGLLINIVAVALLSAPFAFQQIAFDQPNIAVLYFPYIWLPGFIVPIVLFSHLATIRQLIRGQTGVLK